MAEVLNVTIRESRGTKNARRQRAAGTIPAILYGHGESCVSLSVPTVQIETAIRLGSHLVELQGAVTETAFLKNVQWDPLGSDVLHIDLTRVKEGESVEVSLPIRLRGEAPGAKQGGVVEHLRHQTTINCPIVSLPDKLEININALGLGESIALKDLDLPEGAALVADPDLIIVQCVEPTVELDEDDVVPGSSEPEVIGRKAEDEEQESE